MYGASGPSGSIHRRRPRVAARAAGALLVAAPLLVVGALPATASPAAAAARPHASGTHVAAPAVATRRVPTAAPHRLAAGPTAAKPGVLPSFTTPGCTITWVGATDSSFSTATNWSPARTPVAGDDVCITKAGASVVLIGAVTVDALTLGATSGAPVALSVVGRGCGGPGTLSTTSTTALDAIKPTGTLQLTDNGNCSGDTAAFSDASELLVQGQVLSDAVSGGARSLTGPVANQGTVTIDWPTTYGAGSPFDNSGALDIADARAFTVLAPSSGGTAAVFTDDAGGSVISSGTAGTGQLVVDSGSDYTQGSGTTSGQPVLVGAGAGATSAVAYTGGGSSSIELEGPNTLTGAAMSASQTLTLLGIGCGPAASATLESSMTAAGTIEMTSSNCSGYTDTLTVAAGHTLTMSGSSALLRTDVGAGGTRILQGDITTANGAQTTINITTDINAAGTFDAGGPVTIADGAAFNVDNGAGAAFTDDTGGAITTTGDSGTGALVVGNGDTYTQGAGTTSGGPVYVQGGQLTYTGTGASSVTVEQTGTETGNIAAGQTLTLLAIGCGPAATETLTGTTTNAGTIEMTSANCSGSTDTLTVAASATKPYQLTNTGTIQVDGGDGGGRVISGLLVNGTSSIGGHVTINAPTTYAPSFTKAGTTKVAGTKFDNKGQVSLSAPLTVAGQKGGSFVDDTRGTVAATGAGQLVVDGPSTYSQGRGTTSGNPVLVTSGAKAAFATGGGAATVMAQGSDTLSGTINKGQTLVIEGFGCRGAGTVSDAGPLTDDGSIQLTAVNCSGDLASLALTGANKTLTIGSTGSLTWTGGDGGARQVTANVVDDGTMGPSGVYGLSIVGSYTQGATGAYDVATSGGSSDTLAVSGAATLGGSLVGVPQSTTAPGTSWTVLTAASVTGSFASVSGPGGAWSSSTTPTSATLTYHG